MLNLVTFFFKEKGLSVFKGSVKKIPDLKDAIIPRVGWYNISNKEDTLLNNKIFSNISYSDKFYFVHSYNVVSKSDNYHCLFHKHFNFSICTSIIKDNTFLFQFHPEKSSKKGLEIYKNFFSL